MKADHRTQCAGPAGRPGATLMEVLMSLLIMGLGITSVFTLFPMTIVRSIKATNLTNAALMAESVREVYRAFHAGLSVPPAKAPGARPRATTYAHPKDALLAAAPAVADAEIPDPFIGTFVVDPYGGANAGAYGFSPGRFGEVTPGDPSNPDDYSWGVLRVQNWLNHAPWTITYDVDNVRSPDSWITDYEEIPASVANVSGQTVLTFPPGTDLLGTASAGRSRALVLSAVDSRSYPALLADPAVLAPNPNQLILQSTLPASLYDPSGPTNNVGLVRLQSFERRYTFLLTLHRDPVGKTTGQIVVFFRREFGDPELLYPVVAVDPQRRTHRMVIDLSSGTVKQPAPGDYIFGTWVTTVRGQDYHHGRWYRLVAVEETATAGQYRITLDRPWQQPSNDRVNRARVMLPKGVISVFDL